jgi:hypothetical protein
MFWKKSGSNMREFYGFWEFSQLDRFGAIPVV